MTATPVRWIVFDLDDTLVDRTAALRAAWSAVAAELGVEAPCPPAASLTEAAGALARRAGAEDAGVVERWLRRALLAAIQPDAEVSAWLATLAESHEVIVASNGHRRWQRAKLVAAGLAAFDDRLVTSGELRLRKPDPAFFAAVFERFGADPRRTLVVGNDARLDVAAAEAAGARAACVAAPALAELRRAVA